MYSKDPQLGLAIHQLLVNKSVESPIKIGKLNQDSFSSLQQKVKELLELIGLDLNSVSIADTPKRTAKFFINELFYGLNYDNFPKMTTSSNEYAYHNPLFSQSIYFNSTCEHHLVTISGHACVAYIPKDKIIGLSKINRVVDFFAKRPQVQERATRQIFFALQEILATEDVAVAIQAKHHCIAIRGVRDDSTMNLTVEFGGKFKSDNNLQANLYKIITTSKLSD